MSICVLNLFVEHNTEIREKLLQEKELSLQKAFDLALLLEASRKGSSEMNVSLPVPLNKITKNIDNKGAKTFPQLEAKSLAGKCFRCGNPNHRAHDCKLKHIVCLKCNTKGHLASVCLKVNRPNGPNTKVIQKQTDILDCK